MLGEGSGSRGLSGGTGSSQGPEPGVKAPETPGELLLGALLNLTQEGPGMAMCQDCGRKATVMRGQLRMAFLPSGEGW